MNQFAQLFFLVIVLFSISGCDPNSKAEFGSESGLPSNCRAYVQKAIDSYHAKQYSAEATFDGLERNCGKNGQLWAQ